MRRLLLLLALVFIASPAEAQKKIKRDPSKVTMEELAEYGDASLGEVLPRIRPNMVTFNGGGGAGLGEQTISGIQNQLLVYVGSQQQGDTSVLRFYKAADVQEIRYYKPGNSMSPHTAGNAFVIQLLMKDRLKKQ